MGILCSPKKPTKQQGMFDSILQGNQWGEALIPKGLKQENPAKIWVTLNRLPVFKNKTKQSISSLKWGVEGCTGMPSGFLTDVNVECLWVSENCV